MIDFKKLENTDLLSVAFKEAQGKYVLFEVNKKRVDYKKLSKIQYCR